MTSVVMAGGGTAGHTSPLIATAEKLRAHPDVRITCVGTPRGLESRVIPAAGLELVMIPPVPLPRRPGVDLLKVPGRLLGAVGEAKQILRDRRADVVVGFGGYVSMPVYFAARSLKVPVVVHEQNALPGLANQVASRFAKVVAVSFPHTPLQGAQYVGLPLRDSIARLDRPAQRAAARRALGFEGDGPLLLVSGGSQGAVAINDATTAARDRLLARGIDILHVVGPKNMTAAHVTMAGETGALYRPVPFVDAMEQAYAAADLMVGRSGAGTVMETAVVGLPVVFVPLPHGNGEQARNAEFLVEGGAARLVDNADFDGDRMVEEVLGVLEQPGRLDAMSDALRGLVPADAAGQLAALVLEAAGRR